MCGVYLSWKYDALCYVKSHVPLQNVHMLVLVYRYGMYIVAFIAQYTVNL